MIEEKKQAEEEKRKANEEKNKLAVENERQREQAKEKKRKASEAALDKLVQSRKRGRHQFYYEFKFIIVYYTVLSLNEFCFHYEFGH